MEDDLQNQIDELRRTVREQQVLLDEQAARLRALGGPATDDSDSKPSRTTRRDVLRLTGAGVAGAVGSALFAGHQAAAVNGDELIAGETVTAQTSTRLVYDGPTLGSGGAFVAGTGSPPAAPTSTAGIVGYVANSAAQWGVHGTSSNAAGGGVLGSASGAGAGVTGRSTTGPDLVAGGTGFLRLGTAGHSIPSITPQAGDVFRMDDDQLFYTIATGPPAQIVNLVGNVGGLVFLPAPVRAVDTRLGGGAKLLAGSTRLFSLQTSTTGDSAVPEGSRAAMVTVTVDATEGDGGFLTIYAADQPRPFISSVNWFAPGQILANTTMTRVVRPSGAINVFTGVNRTHMIIDVIAYYH